MKPLNISFAQHRKPPPKPKSSLVSTELVYAEEGNEILLTVNKIALLGIGVDGVLRRFSVSNKELNYLKSFKFKFTTNNKILIEE